MPPSPQDILQPSVWKNFSSFLKVFSIIYVAILFLGIFGAYLNISGLPSKSFFASILLNAFIIFQPHTLFGWFSYLLGPLIITVPLSFIFRSISKGVGVSNKLHQWSKWLLFIDGVGILFMLSHFLWNTFVGLLFLDSPQIISWYQSQVSLWSLVFVFVFTAYIAGLIFYRLGKYKLSAGISGALVIIGAVYLLYAGITAEAKWKTDQQQLQTINKQLSTPKVIAAFACPNGNMLTVYDPATRDQYGVFDPDKLYEYSFVRDASGNVIGTTTTELGQIGDGYTLTQPLSTSTENGFNTCEFSYGTLVGGQGKTFSDLFVPAGQTMFDNRPFDGSSNSVTVGLHFVYPSNLGQVDAPSASKSSLTLTFRDAPNLKMIIALDDTLGSSQSFQKWVAKNYGYIPSKTHNPQITDDASVASFTTIAGHEALKVSNYTNDPNHSLYLLNLRSGSVLIFAIQGAPLADEVRDQIVNSVQY